MRKQQTLHNTASVNRNTSDKILSRPQKWITVLVLTTIIIINILRSSGHKSLWFFHFTSTSQGSQNRITTRPL